MTSFVIELDALTERQLVALIRVVKSMNLVDAHISADTDDLLSREEMMTLELVLREILRRKAGS